MEPGPGGTILSGPERDADRLGRSVSSDVTVSAAREETGWQKLLRDGPLAVNAGLQGVAEAPGAQGRRSCTWAGSPLDEDRKRGDLLDELLRAPGGFPAHGRVESSYDQGACDS